MNCAATPVCVPSSNTRLGFISVHYGAGEELRCCSGDALSAGGGWFGAGALGAEAVVAVDGAIEARNEGDLVFTAAVGADDGGAAFAGS